jgi:hypothetical protein
MQIQQLTKKLRRTEKGQSLVEVAIIAPILIFFLIGIFEVGWVLRGYLVLVNVNREITRFAIRPGYLDFSTEASVITSFNRIRQHALDSVARQLDLDFDEVSGNATLIISHLVVDTGIPCTNMANCPCAAIPANNQFFLDDLIVRPDRPGQEYQRTRFGPLVTETGTRTTRIDLQDLISNTLIPQNNRRNCELLGKGGIPAADNIIVTELFFDQPQLFGFPFISNPFTDPVPLYTHTTMRLVGSSRSTGGEGGSITENINTVGPICNVFPIAVRQSNLPAEGNQVDILDGNGNPHYGWLAWNASDMANEDLADQVAYPASSLNNFVDPVSGDTVLSVGDWVTSFPDIHAELMQAGPDNDHLDTIMGREIRIPVYNNFSTNRYQISGFARVRFPTTETDINLAGGNPTIMATYLGPVTEGCPLSP